MCPNRYPSLLIEFPQVPHEEKTHGVLLLSSRQNLWIFLDANKMASWDFSPWLRLQFGGLYRIQFEKWALEVLQWDQSSAVCRWPVGWPFAPFWNPSQNSSTTGKSSGVAFRSRKTMFGLSNSCSDWSLEELGQDMRYAQWGSNE